MCVSTEPTRHTTLYVPARSGCSEICSSAWFERSRCRSCLSTSLPDASNTWTLLKAGSIFSVNKTRTSLGDACIVLPTAGSARSRKACASSRVEPAITIRKRPRTTGFIFSHQKADGPGCAGKDRPRRNAAARLPLRYFRYAR